MSLKIQVLSWLIHWYSLNVQLLVAVGTEAAWHEQSIEGNAVMQFGQLYHST